MIITRPNSKGKRNSEGFDGIERDNTAREGRGRDRTNIAIQNFYFKAKTRPWPLCVKAKTKDSKYSTEAILPRPKSNITNL